jgi:ATP-dependent DNA ligase
MTSRRQASALAVAANDLSSPVTPPIAPMLATLARDLPLGAFTYEPKWDGFRCLAFVDETGVDLRSRHDRPLARYFPEIVAGFQALLEGRGGRPVVVDGEIVLEGTRSDFAVLMGRLHPAASRVGELSAASPARYVAFDLLADDGDDLRARPFTVRRERLATLLGCHDSPIISLTPSTPDPELATSWLDAAGSGIDGVVAKPDDVGYAEGRRALIKVKRLRTADCVVAGVRLTPDHAVATLILGLYGPGDELRHVGVVTQLPRADRVSLAHELLPLAVPLREHPWREGFTIERSTLGRLPGSAARWTPQMALDWVPLRPERVAEVGFDQVDVDRFRHPARLLRWRPDREARSCSIAQLTLPGVEVPGR